MRHVCTVIGCKREFEKASHRNQHEKDAHQSEPAQVSQPVAEICSGFALHLVGSGAIAPIIEKHNLKVGDKLFSSPPDYEALKAENVRLQSECDRSKQRVLELEGVARDSLNALIYHTGQTRPIERTEENIKAIRKTLWEN